MQGPLKFRINRPDVMGWLSMLPGQKDYISMPACRYVGKMHTVGTVELKDPAGSARGSPISWQTPLRMKWEVTIERSNLFGTWNIKSRDGNLWNPELFKQYTIYMYDMGLCVVHVWPVVVVYKHKLKFCSAPHMHQLRATVLTKSRWVDEIKYQT